MPRSRRASSKKSAEIEIQLSPKGFRNILSTIDQSDFTFIVGESQYVCPSVLASFLSPRICDIQRTDPTLREFHVDTPDPNHYFPSILELSSGSRVRLPANERFLRCLSAELGNRELYEPLYAQSALKLSIANVIDRIELHSEFGHNCDLEIEFCSSHFSELESTDLCSLPVEIFRAIVSRESLQLKSEDSLYSMIHARIVEDRSLFSLLEYVRFEYLSVTSITLFLELMNESFCDTTIGIWRSLSRRLSLPWKWATFCASAPGVCPFSWGNQMDGIISYLTRKRGGHVLDTGTVSITTSDPGVHGGHSLRNIVKAGNRAPFCTTDRRNSWICFDFKDLRVIVTQYSIRTGCDWNYAHLRSWRLEGSLDGVQWVELDHQENDRRLCIDGDVAATSIRGQNRAAYRMIRLQQTGQNSGRSDHLSLAGIEFFGAVETPDN
jgi:hypothetical protein